MSSSYQTQYYPQQPDNNNLGLLATGTLAGGGIATLAALRFMKKGKILQDLSQKGRDPNIDAVAGKKYPKRPGPVTPSTPAETVFTNIPEGQTQPVVRPSDTVLSPGKSLLSGPALSQAGKPAERAKPVKGSIQEREAQDNLRRYISTVQAGILAKDETYYAALKQARDLGIGVPLDPSMKRTSKGNKRRS
jgi:hypothetical protein|tara:strand:- start:118 stop:690 length:573 start_codon:yes stop_codon:yes gene_type:complete